MIRVLIFFPALLCSLCSGVTYYVDAASEGTGDGTTQAVEGAHSAWKDISQITGLSAGDSVLFKRGCIWRGHLVVGTGGSAGSHIKFGAYGTGDNPVFNGAALATDWTDVNAPEIVNVWDTAANIEPAMVFFDGTLGTKESSLSGLDAVNEWFWDSGVLYVYSKADPDAAYTSPGIETTAMWWSGIECKYSYITIEDITLKYFRINGILLQPDAGQEQTDIIIQRCTTTHNWGNGINSWNNNNRDDYAISEVLIQDCVSSYNMEFGIKIYEYSNDITVRRNTVHHNGWITSDRWGRHGISTRGGTDTTRPSNVIIEHNTVYNTYDCDDCPSPEGAGIQADDNSAYVTIRYNRIYNNEGQGITLNAAHHCEVYGNLIYNNGDGDNVSDSGIVQTNSHHNRFYHNVIHGNDKYGIYLYDSSGSTTDTMIKNNIFSENAVLELRVYPGAQANFVSNHNQFYHSAGGTYIEWPGGAYTLSTYQRQSNQDANSRYGDPLFVDAAADFRLSEDSPCIDAGVDVGISVDYNNQTVNAPPDIGAYEYHEPGNSEKKTLNLQ